MFVLILKVLLSRLLFSRFCMIVGVIAQGLKEIVSTLKFLFGVGTLSHYDELQWKQLERLKRHVISVAAACTKQQNQLDHLPATLTWKTCLPWCPSNGNQ